MDPDEEERLLRAVALKNAQSILQARQRAEQELRETTEAIEEEKRILELLNQTGARLVSELDLQVLVQAVTDAATQLSGAQFGAFLSTTPSEEAAELTLYAWSGAPREVFQELDHQPPPPIFAPTFGGKGVIRVGDATSDDRYGKMPPHFGVPTSRLPVRSYLAVPVVTRGGEVIGGLFFGHLRPHMFTEREERLAVGIAAQAGIAIDNARLYEEAKRSAAERARLLDAEQRARAEVERISLVKDEFLATLSHELRTPLNAVLGWSDHLLGQLGADSPFRRGLDSIARNARAQAQLIDDLLDMNRIVSGKIRLDVQGLDLATIIEAALESVRPSLEAKEIKLRKTIDSHAGTVFGDPNRVQQIVWNLLSNAVKFTPRGGRIDVVMQRVNSHIEILISDSGIGIDADFLPHLFERFRQAETTSTRKYGGLGLGLAIVKQLVELHGGSVNATSPGEGHGSTFAVSLPLRAVQGFEEAPREHPRTASTRGWPSGEVSLAGLAVLVVDDEPDARELIRAVLEDAEAEVATACSVTEALELLERRQFGAIVSDIGMPERDGYELMQKVRKLPAAQGGRTPAVALTAFARSEDRTRAMLAGFQVHISKPIEPRELIATVKSLAAARE